MLIFISYLFLSIAFFIYSYGFVDFNLTLSSHPWVTSFVSWAQQLAMFNRPLSTKLYLVMVILFFVLYLLSLSQARAKKLSIFPWKKIAILSLILSLAYPLLSSDVFKYLFVGKILVHYQANPYLFSPDHFTGDLWLRFMRWVHTPTPYGPIFSLMAIPYYLLAFGRFTPMLYLYKIDQAGWYLLSIWLIGKIVGSFTRDKQKIVFSQLFFALNPLILVEWLVNAHNDAIMITLLLASFYLLTYRTKLISFLTLLVSIGIKYITIVFLPFILLKKFSAKTTSLLLFAGLFLAPLLYKYSFQYQPWYVTWLIPFAAISDHKLTRYLAVSYAFGSFLRYLPFISTGLWGATLLEFSLLSFTPVVATFLLITLYRLAVSRH